MKLLLVKELGSQRETEKKRWRPEVGSKRDLRMLPGPERSDKPACDIHRYQGSDVSTSFLGHALVCHGAKIQVAVVELIDISAVEIDQNL